MSEKISNLTIDDDMFDQFEFGTRVHRPKFESSVPREITNRVIQAEKRLETMPNLPSSVVEDFVMQEIEKGVTVDGIVEQYTLQNLDYKVRDVIELAERITDEQRVNVFLEDSLTRIRKTIADVMLNVGFTDQQVLAVINNEFFFVTKNDRSYALENGISINCPQAVRKALDYQTVYSVNNSIENIIVAELIDTVGHELGHKIKDLSNFDMPYEWGNPESENTEERFAESWGRILLTTDQALIIEKSRALQTAKVNQIWQKCQHHRFDLIKALKSLQAVSSEKVSILLEARLSLYNGSEPENYSLPYRIDQIKEQLH